MANKTVAESLDRRPDKTRFGICHNCPVTWKCYDFQKCVLGIIPDEYSAAGQT